MRMTGSKKKGISVSLFGDVRPQFSREVKSTGEVFT